jgi:hypothetical protein
VISGILAKILTGGLLDKLLEVYKLRQDGKISEAEFQSRVQIAAEETAQEATKATQETLGKSAILQRAWASVLFLQVSVLVFYQLAAPAYQVITGVTWPSPGVSLEWAYLLVAAMIGAGPLVMRARP